MKALDIRCRGDQELAEQLLRDDLVTSVIEYLAKREEEGTQGVRRRLLATSVRLTRAMIPDLHQAVEGCRQRLGVETPLELYVYASPSFIAACVKPEAGRLFILFSSALLEAFRGEVLGFVGGHELGHHLYAHHEIPIGHILQGSRRPPPALALKLFAWSRYAEISADRAGALCAGALDPCARALFMLASGLAGSTVDFSLDDFLAQVDEMQVETAEPGQGAPKEDWFSTHPFSPLRVKALQQFFAARGEGGVPSDPARLESRLQSLMALMEPSYLEEQSDGAEAMRRLLFAGAIAVANASGDISPQEVAAFERYFGREAYSERLDIERIEAALDDRIDHVRDRATHPKRLQLMRDLCVIARADGHADRAERQVLERIARGLEIQRSFVGQTLTCEIELD